MLLHDLLSFSPQDTIAIIGAGGKTTALWLLARERRAQGSLVTTSTHILPPSDQECDMVVPAQDIDDLTSVCTAGKIVCAAYPTSSGKYTGLTPSLFSEAVACGLAPLYEADGSKHFPAKIHRPHEPVIHPNTDAVLFIAGCSALGQPISQVCHCYEYVPSMQTDPMRSFSPDDLLRTIFDGAAACGLPSERIRIFLNQADTLKSPHQLDPVIHSLCKSFPVVRLGSLQTY